ncbi:MAG: ABC transporter ATP-binding protein, partial [Spirochaetes bacterium]
METNRQNEIILKVDDIYLSYGHVEALKGVSLEVKRGEIVVLVGANGAGKTSVMETILGVYQSQRGVVTFKDKDVTNLSADKIVRKGIYLVPEGRGVFSSMTV